MSQVHQPVLYEEALSALCIKPEGIYVDATFGRGGHARGILKRLNAKGQLIVFDRDPDAIAVARETVGTDPRCRVFHEPFSEMQSVTHNLFKPEQVDGVLLDLGVSMVQLTDPSRGFSFMHDGPLDMRMDPSLQPDAKSWLKAVNESTLADVLFQFGDERYSRRIARAIIKARDKALITTTLKLAAIIREAHPAWPKDIDPATKSFQAIRIFINQELTQLQKGLQDALALLNIGGRMVVISFHGKEDLLVKQFIKKHANPPELPAHIPIKNSDFTPILKAVGKPIKPTAQEVADNRSARSAIMRVAEKVHALH